MIQEARHALDPNVLTLGFARMFAEYKRPNLLLFDRERFAGILRNAERPIQIFLAGKAHPNDERRGLKCGRVAVRPVDEPHHFEVQVILGGLSPECV